MAITYHAGRRIQGLSTDTFPPADFTEDFSEATPTTWTEDSYGGSYDAHLEPYKGSINRLFFDMDYTSVESTSGTLDLANTSLLGSNVSDTKWVMRFRINFSNLSSDGTIWVGLSDNAGASNVAQRFVGCRLKADSGFSCGADNGGAAMTTTNATNGGSTSISTSTDYYVTVERKSETLNTSTIRTGSHTGTVLGTGDDTSISSSQDDLRYWKVMNHLASGGGNVRGYLYDLEIYDGISSVSAVKPTNVQVGSRFEETDTRKMYHYNAPTLSFEDDFDTDSGWTTAGTSVIDTTNEYWRQLDRTPMYKSLGVSLDTTWVCDLDIYWTGIGTSGWQGYVMFTNYGATEYNSSTGTPQYIGLRQRTDGQETLRITNYDGGETNATDVFMATGASANTWYFYRVIRNGNDATLTRYTSDANRTSDTGGVSITSTGFVAQVSWNESVKIQYIDGTGYSSDQEYRIKNVKIYNGVTSPDTVWSEGGT